MNSQSFNVGDTIKIAIRDIEEHKAHTTFFEGVVMAIRGKGANKTFILRKVATDGIAVERIFPLDSPTIEKIKVIKKGQPKRAKLYYLRKKR